MQKQYGGLGLIDTYTQGMDLASKLVALSIEEEAPCNNLVTYQILHSIHINKPG